LLIGLAYLGFVSLGLPDGLLGVAWPSIRTLFKLSLDALGALLITFTLGYLLSSFNSGRILTWVNVGSLLALSCLATAASLLGYALAPYWWIMVMLSFLAGLGGGAIDAGLNTYVATHYSTRALNWLHACFGIGATIGPVIMTSVLGARLPWQAGYTLVGIAQLGLAACFAATRSWWQDPVTSQHADDPTPSCVVSSRSTLQLPVVWLSIAVFFIYTGVEVTAGQWTYTLFTEGRAIPASIAGIWISIYWGSLTVGRIIFGIIVNSTSVKRLLSLCLITIAIGTALIWLDMSNWLSFFGLVLTGLALAPIFPSLIATTPPRRGAAHTANGVGFQVAAAVLGGAALPGIVGVLANHAGLEVVSTGLLVGALVLLFLYQGLVGYKS
jgi:fucose permease